MQKIIHREYERGIGEHEWLHTRFSFSFADWYEPTRMGFGALRVINDDIIDAHNGFGKHPHANMEIITIVTHGAVTHEDSMGNTYKVPAGDIQVMSAGTGVVHAEFNNEDEPLELFQIWIHPREKNVEPRYDQKSFGESKEKNVFELLVSGKKDSNALWINQDAYVSRVCIEEGKTLEYVLKNKMNGVYIFVVNGNIKIENEELLSRDAMCVWEVSSVVMSGKETSNLLIFEVPMK